MMRLKVPSFKFACEFLGIKFIEAHYRLKPFYSYFTGLVDTDGSIVFNYNSNRIEYVIEVNNNEYSIKLCLDDLIPGQNPYKLIKLKSLSQGGPKMHNSILWRYQNVSAMIPLYNYFSKFRLYSDLKYHRIMAPRAAGARAKKNKPRARFIFRLINEFISVRRYHSYYKHTYEFKLYAKFVLKFIKYLNPRWTDTPFIKKHNLIEFARAPGYLTKSNNPVLLKSENKHACLFSLAARRWRAAPRPEAPS